MGLGRAFGLRVQRLRAKGLWLVVEDLRCSCSGGGCRGPVKGPELLYEGFI